MTRRRMSEQRDDREQSEQGGDRTGDGRVGPLLGFDAQVSTDLLKRHFHLPALDEVGHCCRQVEYFEPRLFKCSTPYPTVAGPTNG